MNEIEQRTAAAQMSSLILKRASASRSSGRWRDDDYDVLSEGKVGRSYHESGRCTGGEPWMWSLAYGFHRDRTPTHGRLMLTVLGGLARLRRPEWRSCPMRWVTFACEWGTSVAAATDRAIMVSSGGGPSLSP
jgi:hypothetical protein